MRSRGSSRTLDEEQDASRHHGGPADDDRRRGDVAQQAGAVPLVLEAGGARHRREAGTLGLEVAHLRQRHHARDRPDDEPRAPHAHDDRAGDGPARPACRWRGSGLVSGRLRDGS